MPPEIQRLTETFLHNPVRLEVARQARTASTITQRLIASGHDQAAKREVLRTLLRNTPDFKNAIIFCNRKRDVQTVLKSLERHGFNVAALHGDMDQRARMAALEGFRNGSTQLLVASDVAARGLDIPDVSHVFNFDVPHHAEDYVHRIGRTGRAGKKGISYTIVTSEDSKSLAAIEHMIGSPIEWEGPITAEDGESSRERRPRSGERRGRTGGRGERSRGTAPEPSEAPREERAARPPREPRPPREERLPREARPPREDRASREEGVAPQAAERVREPRPERAPRQDRPALQEARASAPRSDDRGSENRRPRREDHDDAPVVGLGDHVPSFLLRSVRTR